MQNGVKNVTESYPACFGKNGALVGMAADRDIKKGDIYADIPESFTINRERLM